MSPFDQMLDVLDREFERLIAPQARRAVRRANRVANQPRPRVPARVRATVPDPEVPDPEEEKRRHDYAASLEQRRWGTESKL